MRPGGRARPLFSCPHLSCLSSRHVLWDRPPALRRGRTAKELAVEVFEKASPVPVSRLEHAAYLGREFQKAEHAMLAGVEYTQD